jgi:FKBP-type peptidyl-prolyl cis-trans isomerase (trigger factor)
MKNITITKEKGSVVTIEGELPFEELQKHKNEALKNLGANMELQGFRKGHIPPKILEDHIGALSVLQRQAEMALVEHYPQIVMENKIDAIGRPDIAVTKLAEGNPLGFKIRTTVLPEIELPDYVSIATKVNGTHTTPSPVTQKEVEETILDIRKRAFISEKQRAGEENASMSDVNDADLPVLDDEKVKQFGDFKDVDDFKKKIEESMNVDKQNRGREAHQIELLEKILEKTKVEVPQIFIDSEIEKTIAQLKHNIQHMGGTFESYLAHLNKTESQLRDELIPDAEKRAKMHLVVQEIAKEKNIQSNPEEVEKEVSAIKTAHPEANDEAVLIHVTSVLTNQKVFQFLEDQK